MKEQLKNTYLQKLYQLSDAKQYLIALLVGACLPLSFAPIHAIPFVFLSPLVLFILWQDKSPSQAFKLGFVFGFGFFSVGLSWVYIAIHVYGNTPAWIGVVMTALFASYLALFIAVQGWLGSKIIRRYCISNKIQAVIILPVLWLLFEWIRGWFLTGMPWLHLGYAFSMPPLSGFAPVIGVYGISFISVFIAGLIFYGISNPTKGIRNNIVIFIGFILVFGFGLSKVEWTTLKDKNIKVSLVQGNAEQITKWDADKIKLRMDTYARLSRQHWDSDVVLWPENSMSVFYHQISESYLLPLAKEAKESNTDLIVGIPFLNKKVGEYYSSMMSFAAENKVLSDEILKDKVLINKDEQNKNQKENNHSNKITKDNIVNSFSGVFHKVHLVPFGEYVPLADLIRGMVKFFDLPMSGFSKGALEQPLLKMRGEPLATSICYEDSFGEELIRQLPEATILMNGSNNAWYGDSLAPHQHLQIAQMRAIETGRMLIRATTNGVTAFVDHHGNIVAKAPQFEPSVLTYTVQPRTGATPYVRWGNWPIISFVLLLLFGSIIYSNRTKNT